MSFASARNRNRTSTGSSNNNNADNGDGMHAEQKQVKPLPLTDDKHHGKQHHAPGEHPPVPVDRRFGVEIRHRHRWRTSRGGRQREKQSTPASKAPGSDEYGPAIDVQGKTCSRGQSTSQQRQVCTPAEGNTNTTTINNHQRHHQ